MQVERKYDADEAQANMIEQLLRPWNVLNQRVLDVFKIIPRDRFVPDEYLPIAYSEMRIPLNEKVKMLSPIIEGRLLQELRIDHHARVLVIGSGSGFLTACCATLGDHVVAVDLDLKMHDTAKKAFEELDVENVELKILDVSKSVDGLGQFDAILVTGSLSEVPEEWYSLLREGGRLLAVVGQENAMSATLHYKYADDIRKEPVFETQLERLVGFEDKEEFVF